MSNQEKFDLLKTRIVELRNENEKLRKEKQVVQDMLNISESQKVDFILQIVQLKKEKQALKKQIIIDLQITILKTFKKISEKILTRKF